MTSDDRSARAAQDPWLRLGLLGALLALSVLCVHVPATLWAGNVTEFESGIWRLLAMGATVTAAGLLLVAGLLRVLPRSARATIASLLCAVGLVWWAYASFIARDMTVLNGQDAPLDFDTRLGRWEYLLVAVVCVVVSALIARASRLATVVIAALNVALVAGTLATVLAARDPRTAIVEPAYLSAVFEFSSQANVLAILLDGLQSDVADEILRADPELAEAFDGFHLYKDTLSPAPTTFLSLPAIHSGVVYDGHGPLADYFTESIVHRSFMTRFADAGHRTSLIEPIAGLCPTNVSICVSASQMLHSDGTELMRDGARLLDLALFRVAPVGLKRRIYSNGAWLVGRLAAIPHELNLISNGLRLLEEIGQRLVVNDGAPTMKLLHLFSAHMPFVLREDCRASGLEHSFDLLLPQSRCALLAVARLLDRLKQAGIYDDTVILLLADHGIGRETHYAAPQDRARLEWAQLAGGANPAFLLKPRQSRGPLRDAPGAVQLADVGATLCALSGACTMPSALAAGQAPADRLRRFHQYEWKHDYWSVLDIPNVTTYDVGAPLWDIASWRRAAAMPAYRLGQTIRFSAADQSDRYLLFGWSVAEPWGRWTSDHRAQVALRIEDRIEGPLDLVARLRAFIPPTVSRQDVTWVANGQTLGTWSLTEQTEELSEHRLRIPSSAVGEDGTLRLDLRMSAATSPAELGLADDPRRLGVGLADLTLTPSAAPVAPKH